jgi:hypothetical protein
MEDGKVCFLRGMKELYRKITHLLNGAGYASADAK